MGSLREGRGDCQGIGPQGTGRHPPSPPCQASSPGLQLLFSFFLSSFSLPIAAWSLVSCGQVRSSVNLGLRKSGLWRCSLTSRSSWRGGAHPKTQSTRGPLFLSMHTQCPGLYEASLTPGDLLLPMELFFLRIEARTRSEPRWAWWCRCERASWNQSPVRIFSCPGSASEARSLLEDGGGRGCHPTNIPATHSVPGPVPGARDTAANQTQS